MRGYILWHTDLPAGGWLNQFRCPTLKVNNLIRKKYTSVNSDGSRRRAADTAALKLTELVLLTSKLSTTT